jgi:hypothetical protein
MSPASSLPVKPKGEPESALPHGIALTLWRLSGLIAFDGVMPSRVGAARHLTPHNEFSPTPNLPNGDSDNAAKFRIMGDALPPSPLLLPPLGLPAR